MEKIDASFLKTWREKYSWPRGESRYSSEKRIIQIENLMRSRILKGDFTYIKEDLSEIIFWKAGPRREPEMLDRFDANSSDFLQKAIGQVFSILAKQPNDVCTAMDVLVRLKGVGIPVASAILRFLDPEKHRYGVIDSNVAVYLNQKQVTNFDLREGDFWIKKYPIDSCQRNIQEYQKYHNWLQFVAEDLRKRNVTYTDIYGNQQPFAPVDIDMAIFAFMTQNITSEHSDVLVKDLEMHPATPFTNLNQLYRLIASLKGLIQLLDKDLGIEALRFCFALILIM